MEKSFVVKSSVTIVTSCGGNGAPNGYNYKYKNHFNEMKGDVGMSDQQK